MSDILQRSRASVPPWQDMRDAFTEAVAVEASSMADMARRDVLVVVFDLEGWHRFEGAALTLLDAAEAARARRQRVPRNRHALVSTYALHRLLLSSVLGRAPGEVGITRDGKGCPQLPDDDWYTSLSHSAGRAAFAVSATGPVGVDLEPVDRAADMDSIIERVVHRDDVLVNQSADAHGRALLDLWVRKEALLKAAGIGLECAMETFPAPEGVPLPLPDGRFAGCQTLLHMVDAGSGWTCAVACPPGVQVARVLAKAPHSAP